jgi:hypothetical protein
MICIDPGIDGCGVAFFSPAGKLTAACYVRSTASVGDNVAHRVAAMAERVLKMIGRDADRLLLTERPQIYTWGKGKGDPNRLIPLAEICAFVAARWSGPWGTIAPRDWKGTIDGDAMTERIKGRLSPEEMRNVVKSGVTVDHNTFDAIGIGLWRLRRLQKERVIAR